MNDNYSICIRNGFHKLIYLRNSTALQRRTSGFNAHMFEIVHNGLRTVTVLTSPLTRRDEENQ